MHSVSSSPLLNVVRNSRCPHTTGEEGDQGTAIFQCTPSFGPILMGGFAAASKPAPFAPRNCGQFGTEGSALARVPNTAKTNEANRIRVGVKRHVEGAGSIRKSGDGDIAGREN